jgi:two-component system, OmpR family, phosphate regulon response regulator OmpR
MTRERVLLAHGNADCQKIYGSVLTFDGYEVESAMDVASVLDRLAKGHFDLIISDLYLPSSEDECLIRVLRGSGATAHIPVIVLSGWTTEFHRRLAMDMGAEQFLPIPIRPSELSAVVAAVLGRSATPAVPSLPRGNDVQRPLTNGV